MKICGQEMKVTLPIHGREKTFSEQELIAILEKYFSNETTEQATTANVAQVPTKGQWFEVIPQSINQSLFQEKRKDESQEKTRKLILEAFTEVKSSPEKYGRKFKTMMPNKTWGSKTAKQLKELAFNLGTHNADWVEQALEWAQRICNGESWEDVCNNEDTAKWYRFVVWKYGYAMLIGGSQLSKPNYLTYPASHIFDYIFNPNDIFNDVVPLVVR